MLFVLFVLSQAIHHAWATFFTQEVWRHVLVFGLRKFEDGEGEKEPFLPDILTWCRRISEDQRISDDVYDPACDDHHDKLLRIATYLIMLSGMQKTWKDGDLPPAPSFEQLASKDTAFQGAEALRKEAASLVKEAAFNVKRSLFSGLKAIETTSVRLQHKQHKLCSQHKQCTQRHHKQCNQRTQRC